MDRYPRTCGHEFTGHSFEHAVHNLFLSLRKMSGLACYAVVDKRPSQISNFQRFEFGKPE
jgi:hypothetical protein